MKRWLIFAFATLLLLGNQTVNTAAPCMPYTTVNDLTLPALTCGKKNAETNYNDLLR
jgi:hypothetical protein